ncbi:MAG: hypothetical protein ACYTGR_16635 [Planctomycetota bacterium]|jgi:hypothetical protein
MAKQGARVTSIDALGRFRAAYAEFQEQAKLAISNAESDVNRTRTWLQSDRLMHWQHQKRRFERKVQEAKSELFRAQLDAAKDGRNTSVERKNVQKAVRAVEEADHKIERVKYWIRNIEREHMLFRGQMQGLGGRLDRDAPRAMARLATLMDHLDKYIRLHAPTVETTRPTKSVADEKGADE